MTDQITSSLTDRCGELLAANNVEVEKRRLLESKCMGLQLQVEAMTAQAITMRLQTNEHIGLLLDVWKLQKDKTDLMPDFMTGDLIERFTALFGDGK
jgi:hypothetical protein